MSEPKIPEICPGCPTEGRIQSIQPAGGGDSRVARRLIVPCDYLNASKNNPERYEWCQQHPMGQ